MKSRIFLNRKDFLFLHDSMLEKFTEEIGGVMPPNVRQKYGFMLEDTDDEQALPTLKSSIENDINVKEYLRTSRLKTAVETRYSLYQNYLNLNKASLKGTLGIRIDEGLFMVFLKYLRFENVEKFKSAAKEFAPPVKYSVLYYSRDFYVKSFSVFIDYAIYPYVIEMSGFHEDVKRQPFSGSGERKGFSFYINLECKDRSQEGFYLIANVGTITDPQQLDIIVGSFMGISSGGVPTCGECIFVKERKENPFNTAVGIQRLTALLTIRKHTFTSKHSEIRNIDDITTNGTPVSDFDLISGKYAVWGGDQQGGWYQSRLDIDPKTYEAFYYTNVFKNYFNLNKLRCELTISNVIGKKLCITTKSKENKGREIVSFVMVEFEQLVLDHEHVFEAVYITMSRHTGRSATGRIFMMKTTKDIEVKEVQKAEFSALLKVQPGLKKLIDKYKKSKNLMNE